jgi:hypothetical protein
MSQDNLNNKESPPPELKSSFDLIFIRENVKFISERINKMKLEGITTSFDIELDIMESFPEFYQTHPFLVKKICKGEDLTILYKMLEQLQIVESGNKTLSNVELKLGEDLANQYLYPAVNKIKTNK